MNRESHPTARSFHARVGITHARDERPSSPSPRSRSRSRDIAANDAIAAIDDRRRRDDDDDAMRARMRAH
jgi:hypothetical protein